MGLFSKCIVDNIVCTISLNNSSIIILKLLVVSRNNIFVGAFLNFLLQKKSSCSVDLKIGGNLTILSTLFSRTEVRIISSLLSCDNVDKFNDNASKSSTWLKLFRLTLSFGPVVSIGWLPGWVDWVQSVTHFSWVREFLCKHGNCKSKPIVAVCVLKGRQQSHW